MACSEAAELVTGHVYVIFATIAKPPKDKLTICVCAGKNLFLWINTKRNDRQDGQLPLRADDHGVLDRDCFLDCSFVSTFPPVSLASARDRGPSQTTCAIASSRCSSKLRPAGSHANG